MRDQQVWSCSEWCLQMWYNNAFYFLLCKPVEFPNSTSALEYPDFQNWWNKRLYLYGPQSSFYVQMCLQKERPNHEQEYCIFSSRQKPFEVNSGKISFTLLWFSMPSFFTGLPNNFFFDCCTLKALVVFIMILSLPNYFIQHPWNVTTPCFKSLNA